MVFCSAMPDFPWPLDRFTKQKEHHVTDQYSFQTSRVNEQRKKAARFRQKGSIVPLPSSLKNHDVDDPLLVAETASDRQQKLPIAV